METQRCTTCQQDLPATEEFFYYCKDTRNRLRGNCRKCHNKVVQAWSKEHPETRNAWSRRYAQRLRVETLTIYCSGLPPSCQCCGETHIEFLVLDHIANDGAAHRREITGRNGRWGGANLYRWAKRNGYPQTLQVLCFNCNWAKSNYGECPHQRK